MIILELYKYIDRKNNIYDEKIATLVYYTPSLANQFYGHDFAPPFISLIILPNDYVSYVMER